MEIGASYHHQTVALDGGSFRDCTFQSCRLVYGGGAAPVFQSCRFIDCEWKFEGAAADAMSCMKAMWNAGEKPAVQAIIKEITAVGR